jgi:hypothetical protein
VSISKLTVIPAPPPPATVEVAEVVVVKVKELAGVPAVAISCEVLSSDAGIPPTAAAPDISA